MWTQFWDMHSGGSQKLEWTKIYIEADEDEAKIIFYNMFGRNPNRITCTCCGDDYSISSDESLAQLTGYHRNCAYKGHKYIEKPNRTYNKNAQLIKLKDYVMRDDVMVVYKSAIEDAHRIGTVPEQGYVWVD